MTRDSGLPLSQSDLADALRDAGLTAGDGVFVHAAMGQIGPINGGARAAVAALIDVVGPTGLIAMPGFSTDASLPDVPETATDAERQKVADAVLGFDPALSSCREMGLIAEAFRTWPGVQRSLHPTLSITALGPDAAPYLAEHALAWACGPTTPLGKLRDRPNMKMLLVGVGWNRCSLLHGAETMVPKRRTKTRIVKHQGVWNESPDVADDLNRLFPPLGRDFEATGAVTVSRLGQAEMRLCSYEALFRFAVAWFEAHLPEP